MPSLASVNARRNYGGASLFLLLLIRRRTLVVEVNDALGSSQQKNCSVQRNLVTGYHIVSCKRTYLFSGRNKLRNNKVVELKAMLYPFLLSNFDENRGSGAFKPAGSSLHHRPLQHTHAHTGTLYTYSRVCTTAPTSSLPSSSSSSEAARVVFLRRRGLGFKAVHSVD